MNSASQILEDQVLHIKRGRTNQFGWEPAWNSYFDFYISPKYIDPPLLQLEDGMFHLFLRKNLNDRNPQWRMPTVRQMLKRLNISYSKLKAMMERLDKAHLLQKISGYRAGEDGENIPNHYVLSDPIQTLDEFLIVASEGFFGVELKPEWLELVRELVPEDPCRGNRDRVSRESEHPPVAEIATYKQTLNTKTEDIAWNEVLKVLQMQMPATSFHYWMHGSQLLSADKGVAVVGLVHPESCEWAQNRLEKNVRKFLTFELGTKIEQVNFIALTEKED